MRRFCTGGYCFPKMHYMVDVSAKVKQIIQLIDDRMYFCINRARQYGKTNMLNQLELMLQDRYYVFSTSFERAGALEFSSDPAFVKYFMRRITKCMKDSGCSEDMISAWKDLSSIESGEDDMSFSFLGDKINDLCAHLDRPVVLMVDEVDNASNNDVFIHFLGILRDNYLLSQKKNVPTFHSVILAGVTDIRNLKAKIRPDEVYSENSPWNIAVEFNVDMSFSAEEIAGMLRDYEADHQTGMDILSVSTELRRLTSGYPYIVSWLCNWLDTKSGDWTAEGVRAAGWAFIKSDCSLLDDLGKNLVNHPDLEELLTNILYFGASYTLRPLRPTIKIGVMFGYLKDDGANCAKVANPLFEEYLYEYSVAAMRDSLEKKLSIKNSQFVEGTHLNVVHVLNRFQEFLAKEYRNKDRKFLEDQGRLLFLCFLKPIINGTGHYYVEPQTRNNKRMDVVISYGTEEHIVELKIWDGPKYREEGIHQLEDYMDSREAHTGYLLSFNFQKTDRTRNKWLSTDETSKQIYEVIIQCTHDA